MKKEFVVEVEGDIIEKFNIALNLENENKDDVIEASMKEYIATKFARVAAMMGQTEKMPVIGLKNNGVSEYGKALNKIPKWATKQTQVPYRIVRAYLQLSEESEYVSLKELERRCDDEKKHPDVFVKTFSTNFAQMRFDSEKSHGKVFEVDGEGYVYLWEYVKEAVLNRKQDFLKLHSTDIGFINDWEQKNLGKTEKKGTGYGQMLYKMECLKCHHVYYANGHDIFLKKCPNCQGGADTGNE